MPERADALRHARRPSALISVDRAIGELRRGGLVALSSANGTAALILAAEMATSDSLSELHRLTRSAPALALSARRLNSLKPSQDPGSVQSLLLPSGADETLIRQLADPTLPEPALASVVAVVTEPPEGPAAAAIALAKLARLLPAVLVALAPSADLDEFRAWAAAHALLIVDGADIRIYPELAARRLMRVSEARVPLADAEDARIVAFRPRDGGGEHLAILIGRPAATLPPLVRLHSQCFTGDLIGSLRCDCGDQLRGAIREIAAAGGGVVLYLAQEGRDIGLVNKLRAYELQDRGLDTFDANEALGFDADERLFLPAAEMLRQLGIGRIRLLTNNPDKLQALEAAGIAVIERVAHAFPANGHNERYLSAKARSGHLL
jgi:GTP cyclohydrolase II